VSARNLYLWEEMVIDLGMILLTHRIYKEDKELELEQNQHIEEWEPALVDCFF
jgi:hypothetical protein